MPWHFLIHNTLGSYLQPPLCPPVRVNLFQGLGLLLTNFHLGKQLPGQTFPGGFHLLGGQFALSTPLSPNHAAYGGVWGLEVLPIFIVIQGGLCHSPFQAARSGIGGTLTAEESFGVVFELGEKGSPQWHLGSMLVGSSRSIRSNPYDSASWSSAWSCSLIFS